jgi:drug/metabolite transporter (DMT)-like permease
VTARRADLSVIIPFIIFTGIWGSTWIVIRDQLGVVPPQWSVTYRFVIATAAMAMVALVKGHDLRLGRHGIAITALLGFTQFCINFNAVYLAERHITSGVVATVFALLMIPSSLLAWAFLGQRPNRRFVWSSLVAVAGIAMLFVNELRQNVSSNEHIVGGIGLTLIGMLGASTANVVQARPEVRRYPLFTLLTWSMAFGTLIDAVFALALAGPPVMEYRTG